MSAALGHGRPFHKLSGSGNDFVFVDATAEPVDAPVEVETIRRICARGTGIGADGVVMLEAGRESVAFRMRYHNSDGSRASMCGNAALCSTRLAVALGLAPAAGFHFQSDAGLVAARIVDGLPEVELGPVTGLAAEVGVPLAPGERRAGFADSGVPHLVVLADDVDLVDLGRRGAALRHDPRFGAPGANANFVGRDAAGGWSMRTFERGVEGETLACGTGAVATAALLCAWGLADPSLVSLKTRSGGQLGVRLRSDDGLTLPTLRGEGRLVFSGTFADL